MKLISERPSFKRQSNPTKKIYKENKNGYIKAHKMSYMHVHNNDDNNNDE